MMRPISHLALRLAERTGTLPLVNITVDVDVGGSCVLLPLGGHRALNHVGVHEPYLLDAMREALDGREGAVLDVGANIGQTLVKFLALGQPRRYIAFEPNLSCAAQAERIARVNGADLVTVLPVALTDEPGIVLLHQSGEPFDVYATTVPDVKRDGFFVDAVPVPCVRGDDVVRALDLRVALVKIDVEGAEAAVLRGLTNTLQRDRPAIICERLPGARSQETADVLDELGYRGRLIAHQEWMYLHG